MARMRKWRRHTVEFKRQAVERMKTCENIEALARELKVQRKQLYAWKWQFEGHPEPRHANLGMPAEERREKHLQDEITKLKSALAEKTLENDFFKSALRSQRLHSALGYRTPEEFERDTAGAATSGETYAAATLKYFTPRNQEATTSS